MARPFSTESAFRAAAHRFRRRIIDQLAKRDQRPAELVQALGGTRPAMAQHLRVLRETGVIVAEPRGGSILYRLQRHTLCDMAHWSGRVSRMPTGQSQGPRGTR
jgi:DNA-binding transcriptional ArsR family regulator